MKTCSNVMSVYFDSEWCRVLGRCTSFRWSGVNVSVSEDVWDSNVPCKRLTLGPRNNVAPSGCFPSCVTRLTGSLYVGTWALWISKSITKTFSQGMWKSRRKPNRLAGKGVRAGVSSGNRPHSVDKDVICIGGVRNRVFIPRVPAPNGS